jgi:hypothetical protein
MKSVSPLVETKHCEPAMPQPQGLTDCQILVGHCWIRLFSYELASALSAGCGLVVLITELSSIKCARPLPRAILSDCQETHYFFTLMAQRDFFISAWPTYIFLSAGYVFIDYGCCSLTQVVLEPALLRKASSDVGKTHIQFLRTRASSAILMIAFIRRG